MHTWKLLAVTHLAAGLTGFYLAPRELLETEVKSAGFFTTDTRRVLSVTVESLRAENKLMVYSYKGLAAVTVERTKLWIFGGCQTLIVPATVPYILDLSDLTLDKVSYDDRAKIVTVKLPPLVMGEIAFQPEAATMTNGGLLSYSQAQVDELSRQNYTNARKAITKQVQGATLVQAAKAEAKKNVESYFEIPLRIVGQPDVKVVATFDQSP